MAKFGIVSAPVPGHINPFLALASELKSRGHDVVFFQMADVEPRLREEGIRLRAIGLDSHSPGYLPASLRELSRRKGLSALRFTLAEIRKTTAMICRDAPAAVREERPDMLLVDQTEPAGGTVAEQLGLPFITICNALPMHREPGVPPPFSPWSYRPGVASRLRNRVGYAVSDRVESPVRRTLEQYRRQAGLPVRRSAADYDSPLAHISQMPALFDLPRCEAPPHLLYAGPFRRQSNAVVDFPWDRLDGRPLVYASLGTLQGAHFPIFQCFAEACSALGFQAVISHGGRLSPAQEQDLSRDAVVVSYAPQLELLRRATLTITHAGLNTVLDSLSCGVPMAAVPLTFEQPGTAARIRHAGVGVVIPHRRLTAAVLQRALRELLETESYRRNAVRIKAAIESGGGVRTAAALIEQALETGEPVTQAAAAVS